MNRHDLLLRAAVLDGPEALDCWRMWRSTVTVDELDSDAQWLLPLLYQNLCDHGVGADELVRYAGVYRHHWYRNLLLFRQAEVAHGVHGTHRSVVVGGAAIALERPDRIGARPFEVVETLDPVNQLFGDPVDAELIGRACTVVWRGRSWSVLDAADHLVLVCRRRERAETRSSLLWLADAATLIGLHPDLDWARVSSLADELGSSAEVAAALDDVGRRCGVALPQKAGG